MGANVNSWTDWFSRAGDMVEPMRAYEKNVKDYHKLMIGDDKRELTRLFGCRHATKFYEDDSAIPKHLIKETLKVAGITMLVTIIAVLLLSFILPSLITSESMFYSLFACGAPIVDKFTCALVWGVVLAVVACVCEIVPFVLKRKRLIKKLDDGADELRDYFAFIPPKYRNSFCLDALFDMNASYGVSDFASAIQTLDRHIANNASVYKPFAALADVPYNGGSTQSLPERTQKPGEHDKTNPALPEDIDCYVREGVEDADKALNELIGLKDVKLQIQRLKNRISFYDDKAKLGGNHLVFLGPPGTGKTECARIITKLLLDFGYIQENRLIEVDGDYLKSHLQGQSGERTNAVVEYALGGVLFIDEAYLLYDENSSAASETTGVLLKAMEDKRDQLVVIMAGYEDGMERLLASNEGFASRIRHKIRFHDYPTNELMDIFKFFLSKQMGAWRLDTGVEDKLVELFEIERKSPGFGNARTVRNTLDNLLDVHADRSVNGKNGADQTKMITAGDMQEYFDNRTRQISDEGHAFLASKHIDEKIITLADLKSRTEDGSKDPDKELEDMIGLERVKREMRELQAQQEFTGGGVSAGHMAFVGPPGTGKTECARIICGKLYQMGYIRENRMLSVTGDFLCGSYVGQTTPRAEAIMEYARGMVLFIDEAYTLCPTEHGNSFSGEAIAVLLVAMEKYRDDLVVIFAGYEDKMRELFDKRPDLASRVATTLHFESYSIQQLCEIFQLMAAYRDFKVDSGFWKPFAARIKPYVTGQDYGNARFIRQCVDKVIRAHVVRYSQGQIDASKKMTILKDDLEGVEF